MHVICDSPDYARQLLSDEVADGLSQEPLTNPTLRLLKDEFLGQGSALVAAGLPTNAWHYLVLAQFSPHSQYDRMIELARSGDDVPDRTLCLAGAGDGFHGFKGRSWSADAGNIHLTVHVTPQRPIERFEVAFTVLGTLSIVDALDRIPELHGRAHIKWVNDVLVDGAKVAGVLAYTATQGSVVSAAVLGMGLNVETAPAVQRTDFVPAVSALAQLAPNAREATQRHVLMHLMDALDDNYSLLLDEGYGALFRRYRERSHIEGQHVAIYTDESGQDPRVIRRGQVTALGEGLELYLDDDGAPVTAGRLMFLEQPPESPTTHDPAGSEGNGDEH